MVETNCLTLTVSIGIGSKVSISSKIPRTLCIVKKITKRIQFNLKDMFWILTHFGFNNVNHQKQLIFFFRQLNLTQFVLLTCSYFKKNSPILTRQKKTYLSLLDRIRYLWKKGAARSNGLMRS